MLKRIKTASLIGVTGYIVDVETDVHRGLPAFNVVGLADATIRESLRRIRPAVTNSGYSFPNERVTINLMPAGKRKDGSHFDLPIALGVILSQMEFEDPADTAFFGEVSLDGRVNRIVGALPLVMCARSEGITNVVVPRDNADEVAILEDINIYPVSTLADAVEYVTNAQLRVRYHNKPYINEEEYFLDFNQVIGHEGIKRALVIAAAGSHGVLMMGGPGCGKTMMAKRIPSIMPPLTYEEQLEITGIYSVSGLLDKDESIIRKRPFRSPHHSISTVGLMGGGSGRIRPGELSLAHRGIIFLDELGEFETRAIDAMRQPLEEGVVRINRNTEEIIFPSRAMVVVASNPCKCGYLWDTARVCTCKPGQIEAYQRKLTGPFADRIDMHIKVMPVLRETIESPEAGSKCMGSEEMRSQVIRCTELQRKRYEGTSYASNASLDERGIDLYCNMTRDAASMLTAAYESMNMTMRAYGKVMKIARTIADLDNASLINDEHIAEALMYRIK